MDLEKFPLEIRRMIYAHVLTFPGPIVLVENPDQTHASDGGQLQLRALPSARGLSPALLRTCKGVYNEAISYLYEENTFQFPDD